MRGRREGAEAGHARTRHVTGFTSAGGLGGRREEAQAVRAPRGRQLCLDEGPDQPMRDGERRRAGDALRVRPASIAAHLGAVNQRASSSSSAVDDDLLGQRLRRQPIISDIGKGQGCEAR